MNVVVILLTVLAIMGLIAGIVLVASGKIAFAGVIWAVTVILTCIALRIERYRKNGGTSKCLIIHLENLNWEKSFYAGYHRKVDIKR